MVNINANYNAYVDFYNKHKKEFETTGVVKTDENVQLVVDVAQIYNLMKNEGANAVLVILEQLKAQGVAVDGPHIDFNTGTVTFKIGNINFELNLAEGEDVVDDTTGADDTSSVGGTGNSIPQETVDLIKDAIQDLKNGTITILDLVQNLDRLNIPYTKDTEGNLVITLNGENIEVLAPFTPEQVLEEVKNIEIQFTQGNMTIQDLYRALAKLGIEVTGQGDATEFPGKYYVEFTVNGKEWCLVTDKAAMDDGQGGKTVDVWNANDIKNLGLSAEDIATYFYCVAWEGPGNAVAYTRSQAWPEGVNTPQDLKTWLASGTDDTSSTGGTSGADDTSSAGGVTNPEPFELTPEIKQKVMDAIKAVQDGFKTIDELITLLDQYGIQYEKNEYDDLIVYIGGVDNPALLVTTKPLIPVDKVGFDTYASLRNFLFSNECKDLVAAKGVSDFSYGFPYEHVADAISQKHQGDYSTVTKEQLVNEIVAEYNARVAAAGGTSGADDTSSAGGVSGADDTSSAGGVGLTKSDYQTLVDKYIDVWVNDFKTGYTRWGLDTPPTDDEVATFKKRLTELCANGAETLMNSKADEAGVKSWVRAQCDTVIKEIKAARDAANTEALTFEKATALITSAIEEVIEEKLDNIADGITTIHTEFGVDKDGNLVFQNEDTKDVYENLAKYVKSEISKIENFGKFSGILDAIGGEAVLDKLIQAAWMTTYNTFNSSSRHDTEKFLKEVLDNLNRILDKVAKNPESLEYFTGRGCYADTTITNGVTHYNTNTTYGNDEKIDYSGTVTQYEDGTVHISNNKDDNDYQVAMKEILANIKAKYPNIDEKFLEEIFREAQKAALAAAQGNRADCPYGTGNNGSRVEDATRDWGGKDSRKGDGSVMHMDELIQLTLYYFDKMFLEKCITSDIPPRVVHAEAPVAPTETPAEATPAFSTAVDCTIVALDEVLEEKLDNIAGNHSKIHTEFGIDKDGKIVFQESSTQTVYNNLAKYIKSEIRTLETFGKFETILQDLGGEAVLDALIQAAWIDTYNRFNSSSSHNTEAFLTEVIQNLQEILRAVQAHPERLQLYMMHTAYGDTTLTNGVTHYNTNTTNGNDEKINYGGSITVYDDGTVHIANDKDDVDYQTTMNGLLANLQAKYAAYGDITSIFRQAQKAALEAAQGNRADCPYGTGNNGGRVEDATRDWGGKDSRKGDGSVIHMDELVQLTLYYFDKLFYEALKAE